MSPTSYVITIFKSQNVIRSFSNFHRESLSQNKRIWGYSQRASSSSNLDEKQIFLQQNQKLHFGLWKEHGLLSICGCPAQLHFPCYIIFPFSWYLLPLFLTMALGEGSRVAKRSAWLHLRKMIRSLNFRQPLLWENSKICDLPHAQRD